MRSDGLYYLMKALYKTQAGEKKRGDRKGTIIIPVSVLPSAVFLSSVRFRTPAV